MAARKSSKVSTRPIISDNSDWPPHVSHNAAIQVGDGSKWHYLGAPEALLLAGILDADKIPGNPECANKWRSLGRNEGIMFSACRLGDRVAVTLLTDETSVIRIAPIKFQPK